MIEEILGAAEGSSMATEMQPMATLQVLDTMIKFEPGRGLSWMIF